MTLTHRTF